MTEFRFLGELSLQGFNLWKCKLRLFKRKPFKISLHVRLCLSATSTTAFRHALLKCTRMTFTSHQNTARWHFRCPLSRVNIRTHAVLTVTLSRAVCIEQHVFFDLKKWPYGDGPKWAFPMRGWRDERLCS